MHRSSSSRLVNIVQAMEEPVNDTRQVHKQRSVQGFVVGQSARLNETKQWQFEVDGRKYRAHVTIEQFDGSEKTGFRVRQFHASVYRDDNNKRVAQVFWVYNEVTDSFIMQGDAWTSLDGADRDRALVTMGQAAVKKIKTFGGKAIVHAAWH